MRGTPVDRFWSKVRPEVGDACWEWQAARERAGYGVFNPSKAPGKKQSAHRFSWELHYGPIPDGMWVCHRCDNPSCVRPDHLFLGTPRDNYEDMHQKGRHVHGTEHFNSKLDENKVREIREMLSRKVSMYEIAEKYSVTQRSIWNIAHEKTWSHVK